MKQLLLTLAACGVLLAQAQQSEIRIDTFDQRGGRTGYIIVNPNTGRIDQFDARSNRLGYGQVTGSGSNQRIDTYSTNGNRTNNGTLSTTPRR